MKIASALIIGALALCAASAASADPRLDERVYDPYIKNHVFELETQGAGVSGGPLNGARAYSVEAEYGVNDRLRLGLAAKVSNDPGEKAKLHAIGLEAVYYLGQIPRIGVDVGAYLEYAHGLNGDKDVIEGKILAARQFGPAQALVNFIIERPLHEADDNFASYGYAASLTWAVDQRWRVGAEAFGDLGSDHGFLKGRQGAYVGPMVQWEAPQYNLPVDVGFNAGWLKAVGAARNEADSQFRLNIELEHRF